MTAVTCSDDGAVSVGELLSHPTFRRWLLAIGACRSSAFMGLLSYVLVTRALYGGSGRLGGVLIIVTLLANVAAAPVLARLSDRLGVERCVPRLLLAGGAVRLGVAIMASAGAPAPTVVGLVAVASITTAGAPSGTRVMLRSAVPAADQPKALALDSTMIEVAVLGAPVMIAGSSLVAVTGPLYVMALLTVAGGLLLFRWPVDASSRAPRPVACRRDSPTRGRLWRSRRFVPWLLVWFAFGHLLGTVEAGAPGLVARLDDSTGDAALLVLTVGIASAAGGLVYTRVGHRVPASSTARAQVLLAAMLASFVLIATTLSQPLLWCGVVVLGALTAPLNTVMNQAPQETIAPDRATEAFALLAATTNIGFALAGLLLVVLPFELMLLSAAGTVSVVLLGGLRSAARSRT